MSQHFELLHGFCVWQICSACFRHVGYSDPPGFEAKLYPLTLTTIKYLHNVFMIIISVAVLPSLLSQCSQPCLFQWTDQWVAQPGRKSDLVLFKETGNMCVWPAPFAPCMLWRQRVAWPPPLRLPSSLHQPATALPSSPQRGKRSLNNTTFLSTLEMEAAPSSSRSQCR